jgi:hypothetical protein
MASFQLSLLMMAVPRVEKSVYTVVFGGSVWDSSWSALEMSVPQRRML